MKEIIYFKFNTSTAVLFREDDEAVFDFNTHLPFAFIEDNIWYSFANSEPIAFEQDEIVFDYKTQKPLFYFENDNS